MRAVAIVAVLLIHGTASAKVELPLGSRSHLLYSSINSLSYFPVQLFVLLSGLVLFYSYADDWHVRRILGFYRKRIQYVLVPYFVWSLFYYLYNQWLNPTVSVRFSWSEFSDLLPWAEAGYHLYFIAIIAQFYALFPLLVSLVALWKPLRSYLWLIGVAVQIAFSVYSYYAEAPIPYSDRLFLTYFALFCIGGSIGMHYTRVVAWLDRNVYWVTAATVAAGFAYLLLHLLGQYGMSFRPWEFEALFALYPVLVAFSLIWVGRRLAAEAPRLSQLLFSLGSASFGIYLMHPALQSLYMTHVSTTKMPEYHLALWGCVLLMLVVPWAIIHACKRISASWVIFGR